MENSLQSPCSPSGAVDCEPELKHASSSLYDLRNKRKVQNFIFGEITSSGYLKYHVENLPKDGTGCPGEWLFEVAWLHFVQSGVTVKGIRGEWDFGDNLDTVNQLTANSQITVEEAAKSTWSGERAKEKGFNKTTVIDSDGTPGNYVSIQVLFLL